MSKIKTSIIIVSFNTKDKLIKCVNDLKGLSSTELIIIDNNSDDGSFNAIQSISKIHTCVNNENNVGFSKAVNQGIKLSSGQYILLLNPDTIPEKEAIVKLEKYLDKNLSCGIVGGRLLKPDNKGIHGTFVNKPNFLTAIFEFTNLKKIFPNNKFSNEFYYKNKPVNKPQNVYGLSGGFLMIRSNILDKVGLLDENFFMYLEDVDFGIRVRSLGFKAIYLPSSKIVHDSGSSSKNSVYSINVSAWRKSKKNFFSKHLPLYQAIIVNIIFILDDMITDIIHLILGKPLR